MNSEKYFKNLESLENALHQFEVALHEPESAIVRDATIRRFEFSYELLWKTTKGFLEEIHGIRTVSPRQVFKEAFALGLINKEELFIEMIEARNTIAHTYNEDQAISIYKKCPGYLSAIKHVFDQLNS